MAEININMPSHQHQWDDLDPSDEMLISFNPSYVDCGAGHSNCKEPSGTYAYYFPIWNETTINTTTTGRQSGQINVNNSHNHMVNDAHMCDSPLTLNRDVWNSCPSGHYNCHSGGTSGSEELVKETTQQTRSAYSFQQTGEISVYVSHQHTVNVDVYQSNYIWESSPSTCPAAHPGCQSDYNNRMVRHLSVNGNTHSAWYA